MMAGLVGRECEVVARGMGHEVGLSVRQGRGVDGDVSPRGNGSTSDGARRSARLVSMTFADEPGQHLGSESSSPAPSGLDAPEDGGAAGTVRGSTSGAEGIGEVDPSGPELESSETSPSRVEESFVALYANSYVEMVRLASTLTGSREAAEDLVQDSFVRLHRHWPDVRQPRAYLQRAVVNACKSDFRRKVLARRLERADANPSTVSPSSQAHVDTRSSDVPGEDEVGEAAGEAWIADELIKALKGLPYRQKAALVLRFYADLSEVEIAAILRCRPGTVGSLVHRGLDRMREVVNR